jgi:riboflavin biosynthesis pyrimidine reductase
MTPRFAAFAIRKERESLAAVIPGYTTTDVAATDGLTAFGNTWTENLFDGPFYRSVEPASDGLPTVSLVFVESLDGNTVADDPSTLGGGETDLHLIYEGLSRVDADAVMAGSVTARGKEMVFSVWHPELVSLRRSRGKPRHPAQVIVTERGNLRFDDALIFLEPQLRVYVVAHSASVPAMTARIGGRHWIEVIDAGEPMSMSHALRQLRRSGIEVLSCVGGPRTATALIDEELVQDVYLTTSALRGGEPATPFYSGRALSYQRVLLKKGRGVEQGVTFAHLRLSRRFEDSMPRV